jgi:sugar lactone lactonase YvrE
MIAPDGAVSTFAGGGGAGVRQAGFIDGMTTEAAFNEPSAIAVEPSGNLLVADSGNHAIRRITPNGLVQTIVGNGDPGDADGTTNTSGMNGTARLNFPCGVASSGTYIYIADSNNNKIRRVYMSGDQVITLAGSGSATFADGIGTAASFKFPTGLALAPGALFVADTQNYRIRRIETATSSATVSTLAGNSTFGAADGLGSAASFKHPRGVAVSDSGYVYVADTTNSKIRKVTFDGHVTTLAGNGFSNYQDGPGLENAFSSPRGLAAGGQGKVFVADTWNNRIRLILTR